MGEINSFPIFTKTVLELDDLSGSSTSYLDSDLIYDESVGVWKKQSINERRKVLATIYPTVASLEAADLAYDIDIPVYVQVEENDYTLYKIINTAPEPSDILLNNGNVARPQPGTNSLTVNTRLNIFDKNPRVGDVVTTKGCDAIADGGHGTFDIVASTSLPVDGYSVISGGGKFAVLRPVDGYYNLFQLGCVSGGVTDNAAGFTRANALHSPILIPAGNFYSTTPLVIEGVGLGVVGCGMGRSIITCGALTGEAVRLMSQYQIAANFSIRASAGRSSQPYTSNGFGVRVETVDVADDPNITRQRCVKLDSLEVEGQTGAAIYIVGPVTDGGSVTNCRIFNNKGHVIAIDRGFLGGRVNKASLPTGVMNITDCLAFGNTGHAVALGHPDDALTTQTVRVVIDNFDANIASMDAAQMYSAPALHGFWMAGSNNELTNSVTSGSGTQIGAFVKGTNTSIRNFRQVNTFATLEVGDNVIALPTRDITLDGVNVVGGTQANCVILSNATNIRDINIRVSNLSGITNLVDTTAIRGLTLNNPVAVRKSITDTVYNNTTSPTPINGLSYTATANEVVNFRAGIFYSGDSAADLRLTVGSTAAVSSISFGSTSGLKVGSSLTADVISAVVALNSPIVLGCDGSKRFFEFAGTITNGASDATITINAAQLVATSADTTIYAGSYFHITTT